MGDALDMLPKKNTTARRVDIVTGCFMMIVRVQRTQLLNTSRRTARVGKDIVTRNTKDKAG